MTEKKNTADSFYEAAEACRRLAKRLEGSAGLDFVLGAANLYERAAVLNARGALLQDGKNDRPSLEHISNIYKSSS